MTAPAARRTQTVDVPATADDTHQSIIAITGIRDTDGDLFEVGALGRAARRRRLAVTAGPEWTRHCGTGEHVVELAPGDPRLPATLPDGQPWPPDAGALVADVRYFVEAKDGRAALAAARAAGPGMWALGFKVIDAEHDATGLRRIRDLDVLQAWPRGLPYGAKSTRPGIEVKAAGPGPVQYRDEAAIGRVLASGIPVSDRALICVACGKRNALALDAVPPGFVQVCDACVESATLIGITADAHEGAEAAYGDAIINEQPFEVEPVDGDIVPLTPAEAARRGFWRP